MVPPSSLVLATPRGGRSPTDRRSRIRGFNRQRQGGAVLLVAAVVLALMFLASLGVLRAADTGNLISGNYAFQQASTQASDRAIGDALTQLQTLVVSGGANTAVANRYLALKDTAVDSRGIPSAVDWSAVACVDPNGTSITNCAADSGGYRIQYVIERQCASNPTFANIADIRAKCEYEPSAGALSASSIGVRYRILVRVRGPRGTEGWFESVVSGPAST